MVIGIDSSRAFIGDKTGTENYSYHLITSILRLPESKLHTFVLFIRPNATLPLEMDGYTNVKVREIKLPYLWTQLGLAWETWTGDDLDVLWIPAHTLPVLRKPSIRTVVTIHGLEYQWLPEYKNWLQKWYLPLSTYYAVNSANRLIAVSKFTEKQLLKELHTNSKKIKVIHEGVATIKPLNNYTIGMTLKKYDLRDKKYALFVGTVQPRKNLTALIEAYGDFVKSLPDQDLDKHDYKLVIAGSIGWMAQDTLSAPSRLGIQEKVVFTGRVTDLELRDLYLGAQIYVQPSITEGFGLPVLEAMGAGVPVISSNGGALPEVVGNAGLIVELGAMFRTELAKTIKKLVENPRLRQKLIDAGKNRVREYSWEKVAKETLKLLIDTAY